MAGNFWRGSHYLEWLQDRQDVMRNRLLDLEILGKEEDYQKVMIFFVSIIQMLGKGVEVRQQVIATATMYFKRFYSRNSLKSIDPWLLAPSCLFLASKVEEHGLMAQKTLMNTCRSVVASQYNKYFPEYTYPYRPQDVVECEFILLEALDCSLIVFHPYRSLINFCEDLRPQLLNMTDTLLQRSWRVINDSYKTDVSLFYPPYIVTLGCMQVAFLIISSSPECISTPVSGVHVNQNRSSNFNYVNQYGGTANSSNTLNPLAVAERWFADLLVDNQMILEVAREMFALYQLLETHDDAELRSLLSKVPKPELVSPNQAGQSSAHQQNKRTSASPASMQQPPQSQQQSGQNMQMMPPNQMRNQMNAQPRMNPQGF